MNPETPPSERAMTMRANSNQSRKFKATADHMYSKRQLPVKAVEALDVLGKIVSRIETLFPADAINSEAAFLLNFTTMQALEALNKKEKAFLPPVFRHLLVQVRKNWRDGGAISVVQEFSNNTEFMHMLDVSMGGKDSDVSPVEKPKANVQRLALTTALSDDVIMTMAKHCGFDDHPKLSKLWDIAERGPLSERNKEIVIKAIKRCGYNSVEIETQGEGNFLTSPSKAEIVDPVTQEINAKSGHDMIRDLLRKEKANAPKEEPKTVTEIEVGGKVTSIKTIPKALVISKVPTAIGKGRTFTVTAITPRKGSDILTIDGIARVPAEYFEVA